MATYFSFTFNGNQYEGRATSRSTRNGFAHDIVVRDSNYNDVVTTSRHYLNRTWECFQYESVLHDAIGILRDREVEREIEAFKDAANLRRLPKGAREQIEAKWREDYDEAVETIKAL